MSSPGQSSSTAQPAVLFEDLLRQLGKCHQNALQELEEKVIKLKKERCLDAQRLEVFYSRTQRLKEQTKTLQDAISLLEDRLRAGECERCAILEENIKNSQDENERLITKLKHERKSHEDENRNLHAELQKLKTSRSEPWQALSPEQEDGIIPDSPILPSSLPVTNKLKKCKNIDKIKNVRYMETVRPTFNNSLFKDLNEEPVDALKNPGGTEVLVPNTCELDTSQILKDDHMGEVIAETCGLELLVKPCMKAKTTAGQQKKTLSPWRKDIRLKPYRSSSSSALIYSPDSTTEKSPSLLPSVKRLSEDSSIGKAKRKKEGDKPDMQEENQQGIQVTATENQKEGQNIQVERVKRTSRRSICESLKKQPSDGKVQSSQNGIPNQTLHDDSGSPAFKMPKRVKEIAEQRRNRLQDLNASHVQPDTGDAGRKPKLDSMWSIDPALAYSMYDSERRADEEKEEEYDHGESVDTDCTWVSHSLLQRGGENDEDRGNLVSGIGEKANDSMDQMFDTTTYGDYKSFNSSHPGRSQPCDDEEEEEEKEEDDEESPENSPGPSKGHKAGQPTFAHVAVVRKKDERRKLKGTTCKECDIYYAHLPEDEKKQKLSACSRHRFLYIPPCTPENFWEVGFPSTQTCIDRGYTKEEKSPQARSRRRQPFNALFSQKKKRKESQKDVFLTD